MCVAIVYQVTMISTRELAKDFHGFRAVDGVNLDVKAGSMHALVGPNGAGKTTLFNMLTGFIQPSEGQILIDDVDVTSMAPEQIAKTGVARSFQITSLFAELSLMMHVELAIQGRSGLGMRFWRSDKRLLAYSDEAHELLRQVGLDDHATRAAGTLSYGQKRALELALALALKPKLLLLDEPTAGMGIEDVARTIDLIARIREGRTVVMVEHNMKVVGSLAERVTVLQFGQILAAGSYDDVRADPRVVTAYLGTSVA